MIPGRTLLNKKMANADILPFKVVQVHEIKQQQEAGDTGREGEAGRRHTDHQGGEGGRQRQIPVHGQQQRRRRKRRDSAHCHRFQYLKYQIRFMTVSNYQKL